MHADVDELQTAGPGYVHAETRNGLEELDLVMQDYVKQPYELC